MKVAYIDLEGVLIPELWPHISQKTGIASLSITTREFPDYHVLMKNRTHILKENKITLFDLQAITKNISHFSDARSFLGHLKKEHDVSIISDCFHELITPILIKLGSPSIICHKFRIDPDGFIVDCIYADRLGKETHVEQAIAAGAEVLAVGDAFNDLQMLRLAHYGFLIRPSDSTRSSAPEIPVAESLGEIIEKISSKQDYLSSTINQRTQERLNI
jgi:phosphoserine/homoserine phosphotransferase